MKYSSALFCEFVVLNRMRNSQNAWQNILNFMSEVHSHTRRWMCSIYDITENWPLYFYVSANFKTTIRPLWYVATLLCNSNTNENIGAHVLCVFHRNFYRLKHFEVQGNTASWWRITKISSQWNQLIKFEQNCSLNASH